jgi:hypothetical protein
VYFGINSPTFRTVRPQSSGSNCKPEVFRLFLGSFLLGFNLVCLNISRKFVNLYRTTWSYIPLTVVVQQRWRSTDCRFILLSPSSHIIIVKFCLKSSCYDTVNSLRLRHKDRRCLGRCSFFTLKIIKKLPNALCWEKFKAFVMSKRMVRIYYMPLYSKILVTKYLAIGGRHGSRSLKALLSQER